MIRTKIKHKGKGKNSHLFKIYHCENCKIQFVAVENERFCFRCGLMAKREVEKDLPF